MLEQSLGHFHRLASGVDVIFKDEPAVFVDQCVFGGRRADIDSQVGRRSERQYVPAGFPLVGHLGFFQDQRRCLGHGDGRVRIQFFEVGGREGFRPL